MNCYKFYINKYAFVKDEIPDLSFIPMLMRRKLDNFGKAALYSLYNVYEENTEAKLIFASCYGDIERVKKLINQRQEEGEISPTGFSFSVHNATIGLFSLLKNMYLLIYLAAPGLSCSMQDLLVVACNQTQAPCIGNMEP